MGSKANSSMLTAQCQKDHPHPQKPAASVWTTKAHETHVFLCA